LKASWSARKRPGKSKWKQSEQSSTGTDEEIFITGTGFLFGISRANGRNGSGGMLHAAGGAGGDASARGVRVNNTDSFFSRMKNMAVNEGDMEG
jgi:hypothetical protein